MYPTKSISRKNEEFDIPYKIRCRVNTMLGVSADAGSIILNRINLRVSSHGSLDFKLWLLLRLCRPFIFFHLFPFPSASLNDVFFFFGGGQYFANEMLIKKIVSLYVCIMMTYSHWFSLQTTDRLNSTKNCFCPREFSSEQKLYKKQRRIEMSMQFLWLFTIFDACTRVYHWKYSVRIVQKGISLFLLLSRSPYAQCMSLLPWRTCKPSVSIATIERAGSIWEP